MLRKLADAGPAPRGRKSDPTLSALPALPTIRLTRIGLTPNGTLADTPARAAASSNDSGCCDPVPVRFPRSIHPPHSSKDDAPPTTSRNISCGCKGRCDEEEEGSLGGLNPGTTPESDEA